MPKTNEGGDDGFEGSGAWGADDAPVIDNPKQPDEGGEEPKQPDEGAGAADAGEADSKDGGDEEIDEKPRKQTASERIRELNKRLREAERARDTDRETFETRFSALENRLQGGKSGDTSNGEDKSPDPADTEKYPLGVLDERYIEDKIEWTANRVATEKIDGVLQRQEQREQQAESERQLAALREKADDLTVKGADLHEDFEEIVVQAGLNGDYPLTQTTFEAAAEADHGAQILYDLAGDPKEALRVSKLSPYAQVRFIADRNAEIAGKSQTRKIPGAGTPPSNQPRGAGSKTEIRADTDNLDDFEKAFYAKKR